MSEPLESSPNTEAEPNTAGTNYAELFATAQTAGELREQAVQRTFQVGDLVNIIAEGGTYEGTITAIESRPNQTEDRDYDYATVAYQAPSQAGAEFGTAQKTETIRVDKLALMQISDEHIERVSPSPSNMVDTMRGKESTLPPSPQ